nr:endogenous retrovirus group S71 member 1 Env polyprotein-like [Pongo pygmaeus]
MGPQAWIRPLKTASKSGETVRLILFIYLSCLFSPIMSSVPSYSFLFTSFTTGRVFANTTWRAGTSKEVTFAVDLCALFPEPARTHEEQHNLPVIGAESVDLAAGFGHSGSQTGCGSSKEDAAIRHHLGKGD